MNLAFGLELPPPESTRCQSDQVLSGVPVFPLLVDTSMRLLSSVFQESLPQDDTASVSFTVDSYVPNVASASPMRKSFPIFDDAAYNRFPTANRRVVCSSVDSSSNVVFFGPSREYTRPLAPVEKNSFPSCGRTEKTISSRERHSVFTTPSGRISRTALCAFPSERRVCARGVDPETAS